MICQGLRFSLCVLGRTKIEVELIGLGLGEEFAAAGEGFQIEELIFDQPMHGFDIALVGVGSGRDAHVLAVAQGGGHGQILPAAHGPAPPPAAGPRVLHHSLGLIHFNSDRGIR